MPAMVKFFDTLCCVYLGFLVLTRHITGPTHFNCIGKTLVYLGQLPHSFEESPVAQRREEGLGRDQRQILAKDSAVEPEVTQ
jgi:hypothetical protein